MKLLRLLVLPAVFSLTAFTQCFGQEIAPAHAGPGASNGWEETGASQSTCIEMAKQALRASGHSEVGSSGGQSAYGGRDGYSSVIRCVSVKGVAFFFVYGPSTDGADSVLTSMRNRFQNLQRR
jgi:hypothetical protein